MTKHELDAAVERVIVCIEDMIMDGVIEPYGPIKTTLFYKDKARLALAAAISAGSETIGAEKVVRIPPSARLTFECLKLADMVDEYQKAMGVFAEFLRESAKTTALRPPQQPGEGEK